MIGLKEYGPTLPNGTGYSFHLLKPLFVQRAQADCGRYAICTSAESSTPSYTVVDWFAQVRGVLTTSLSFQGSLKAPTTAAGPDEAIDAMVRHLEDPRRRVSVAGSPLKLTTIIFATPESTRLANTGAMLAEEGVQEAPGSDLVHVGPFARLTHADRCELFTCGARAFVAVRLRATGQHLQFCAHHYQKYAVELATRIDAINDQRRELEESVKPG